MLFLILLAHLLSRDVALGSGLKRVVPTSAGRDTLEKLSSRIYLLDLTFRSPGGPYPCWPVVVGLGATTRVFPEVGLGTELHHGEGRCCIEHLSGRSLRSFSLARITKGSENAVFFREDTRKHQDTLKKPMTLTPRSVVVYIPAHPEGCSNGMRE